MSTERTPVTDEVLRRIGRNLVMFQQVEHALKWLLTRNAFEGPIEEYADYFQTRAAHVNAMTLGKLVEMYSTEVLRDAGEAILEKERPADWVTFSFRTSAEADYIAGLRSDLKSMTDERNQLVHHFLPRWQPHNAEALTEALAYLDEQQERVRPMHEHVTSSLQRFVNTTKLHHEFLASPEYEAQAELMWLQSSPLVTLLYKVPDNHCRKDGWTDLAHAGAVAGRVLPNEVKKLKERYGFHTLKQLIVGVKTFDVMHEETPAGGFHTLYRRKSAD